MEVARRGAGDAGARTEGAARRDAAGDGRGATAPDGDRGQARSDRGGRAGARRPHAGGRTPPLMTGVPALSIVVTSRNDDYGGPYTDRILKPLRFNCDRLTEHGVPFEVILVEWDPVPGRKRLSELLPPELPNLPPSAFRRIVVASQYQAALTQ